MPSAMDHSDRRRKSNIKGSKFQFIMQATKEVAEISQSGTCRKRTLVLLMGWIGVTLIVFGYNSHKDVLPTIVTKMFIKPDAVVTKMIIKPDVVAKTSVVRVQTYNRSTTTGDGCKGFDDPPVDETIAKYFKRKQPLKCKTISPNYLYVTDDGKLLKINREKVKQLKATVDFCKFAPLKRETDFKTTVLPWSKTFTESISVPDNVEHILGQCFYSSRVVGTSYLSIVRKVPDLEKTLDKDYQNHVKKNNPKETLSVLMIGIDGTSKLNFARQMPKTKSFVVDKLGGIELYKLNKVGLNTFPNVMPMLTGRSYLEVRKNWTDKEYFDKIDHWFLWDEARLAGYRTSVILDKTKITAFHYLKKGWNKAKFHYYNRAVVVKSEYDKTARSAGPYCVGDQDEISVFYDYWLQLTRVFNNTRTTPYFGYSFFAHVTHDDINMASTIDDTYFGLLQKLHEQKVLNNTVVVFFSDHGCRYGKFRSTFRGMLEDSNPFMFFIFPPWFQSKYPKIVANFRKNQHRVMTNFDVHATLKDVLYFHGDDVITRNNGNRTRGLSLFQELPVTRTCEEAGIPIKYCNCRNFSTAGITPEITERVSKHFLKEVVAKSKKFRSQCVALTLNATQSMMAIFTTSSTHDFFQAQVKTSPGGAVYEATLKMKKVKDVGKEHSGEISLEGDIQRVNMYRGQADCIQDARIRSFCYCRNLL